MLTPLLRYLIPVLLLALGLMVWFLIQVASGRSPNDHGEGAEHGCSTCGQTGTCSTAFAPEQERTCAEPPSAPGGGAPDTRRA